VITIDIEARRLDHDLDENEVESRMRDWQPPEPRYASGVFAKYAALVSSAAEGAITRPHGD
jgi:dihydroxy-acid dehydratase